MEKKPRFEKPLRRRRNLTIDEQLSIARRVEAGEDRASICEELQISRQVVSRIVIKYEEGGANAFTHKKRGPKKGPMPEDEKSKIMRMLKDKTPADYGVSDSGKWTIEAAQDASISVLGKRVDKRQLRGVFREADVAIASEDDSAVEVMTPEFRGLS